MNVIVPILLATSFVLAQGLEPFPGTSPSDANVYLPSSGSSQVKICEAPTSTPTQISTCVASSKGQLEPAAHGVGSNCGTPGHICYVRVAGVISDWNGGTCANKSSADGTPGATYVDRMLSVKYIDATTLALYYTDTVPIGPVVTPSGRFCEGGTVFSRPGAAWVGQLEPDNLGPQPSRGLDGQQGRLANSVSLGPTKGMATNGLRVDGCPRCYITVTLADTGYDLVGSPVPLAAGDNFSAFRTVADLSVNGPPMTFGKIMGDSYDELTTSQYISPDVAGATRIVRWSSTNPGAWPLEYGDQSSTYAHVCADSSRSYLPTWQVASSARCITDFKHNGWDQFVIEQDEVFLNAGHSEPIQRAIQYPKNGSRTSLLDQSHPTRLTICVDTQARQIPCSNLKMTDRVMSTEDRPDSRKGPYGVLTQIYFPGVGTLSSGCAGVGDESECRPMNTHVGEHGGNGQVTIAGGGSIGDSVSAFEAIVIHKFMNGQLDKSFITVPLSPGASWTGGEACGANSCVAYLGSRGTLQQSVPAFTTSAGGALPYQYLISGLSAGIYEVTARGSPVKGSPFNVLDRNNSIEFESAGAGLVTVTTEPVLAPPNAIVGFLTLASSVEAPAKNSAGISLSKASAASNAVVNNAKGSAAPRSTNGPSPFIVGTCGAVACDYVIGGMLPGIYTVTVAERPVWGGPITVVAGDTSMWFEAGAGVLQIDPALLVTAAVLSIVVSGKGTLLAHDSSEQLTAMGSHTDGSVADLTDQVTWVSSAPSVVSISAVGVAKALAIGQAHITAALNGVTSNGLDLAVAPPTPCDDSHSRCREH